MNRKFDVIVIGSGVTGSAIAMELSRYDISVCVLEKEEDVCSGTSKANSAIVHAGFDAKAGTMKAVMNLRGNELMEKLSEDLDFEFKRNGSLVLCFSEKERPALKELYERGVKNGVPGLRILESGELHEMEPNIEDSVAAALYAPTGGIVCPFGLNIAMAENAADNGAVFFFGTEVENIRKAGTKAGTEAGKTVSGTDTGFLLETSCGEFVCRYVVNAAGVCADVFHNQVSEKKLHIIPRAGEYNLLDKEAGNLVNRTIFQLPTKMGKGVLVTPTVHGNLLIGPTAADREDKEDTATTAAGLAEVQAKSALSVKGIPYNKVITAFSGLRAHEEGGDFVLGECEDCEGFFDAAGIESPGLTSAPAIGEYMASLIAEKSGAKKKENAVTTRKGIPHLASMSFEERAERIKTRPDYGRIVCRCEGVSEGEIRDAINRTLGAKSLDGIKRRVRQGMGRCQAGFCTPRTMEILSEETGVLMEKITKNRPGSELLRDGYASAETEETPESRNSCRAQAAGREDA